MISDDHHAKSPGHFRKRKDTWSSDCEFSDADVERIMEQFAFHNGFQIQFMRSVIDQAVTFYYRHVNPPTPNARHKQLIMLRDCANTMLGALNHCTDECLPELFDVEPRGIRSMLYQLRDAADKRAQDLLPQVQPDTRQRRSSRKGLDSFIVYLHYFYKIGTGRSDKYTQDPFSFEYRGPFIDFLISIRDLCHIDVSRATIGDAVKKCSRNGRI